MDKPLPENRGQESAIENIYRQINLLVEQAQTIPIQQLRSSFLEEVDQFKQSLAVASSDTTAENLKVMNAKLTTLYQSLKDRSPSLQAKTQGIFAAGSTLVHMINEVKVLATTAQIHHDHDLLRKTTTLLQEMESSRTQLVRALDNETIENIIGRIASDYQALITTAQSKSQANPNNSTALAGIHGFFAKPAIQKSKELEKVLEQVRKLSKK